MCWLFANLAVYKIQSYLLCMHPPCRDDLLWTVWCILSYVWHRLSMFAACISWFVWPKPLWMDWLCRTWRLLMYRACQKSNPLGKILYIWNCSRYIYQICRVYRWGFSPHILLILLKLQVQFNRYNSLNFKVHFFQVNMQSYPEYSVSLT